MPRSIRVFKVYRGVLITLVCSVYPLFLVDYDRPLTYWGKFTYVIVMIIAMAGGMLYLFDFVRMRRKRDESEQEQNE
jgi:hypothetical protein